MSKPAQVILHHCSTDFCVCIQLGSSFHSNTIALYLSFQTFILIKVWGNRVQRRC